MKPTRQAIANYYRLLQDKANDGDTDAAGWLCQLDLLNQRTRPEETAR